MAGKIWRHVLLNHGMRAEVTASYKKQTRTSDKHDHQRPAPSDLLPPVGPRLLRFHRFQIGYWIGGQLLQTLAYEGEFLI